MSPGKYSSAVLATPIFSEAVGKATENLWPWILPKRVAAGSDACARELGRRTPRA
jgi:hypothetical protein